MSFQNWPDSPEAVAPSLLEKILERDDQTNRNEPPATRLIALYAECLAVVTGRNETPGVLH